MTKGLLLVISGLAGSGKGTICKMLTENAQDLELSVSVTTRVPRDVEIEGEHYYFIDVEEFRKRIEDNEFLEYVEVYGKYYGTSKAKVIEKLQAGITVILETNIEGALKVKKNYPEGIFILIRRPLLNELERRMTIYAANSVEVIEKKMQDVNYELNYAEEYNYVILNDNCEDTVRKIGSIIDVEKMKASDVNAVF